MADAYIPRFKSLYDDKIIAAMTEKFGYKNVMEVPKITKIVLNMGVGEATQDKKKVALAEAYRSQALRDAKTKGAMADPTTFPAEGNWTSSRRGSSRQGWPDRGNQGSLIG